MELKEVAVEPGWVAIDKPPGIVTIPDRFGSDSVHGMLEKQRGERLWVVHRLDREVGGLLIFARTAEMHRTLSMAFEKRETRKYYLACSEGALPGPIGTDIVIRNKLLRGKKRSYESPHGSDAETLMRPIREDSDGIWWDLLPKTGRNHQLRVHLASLGCPIRGDALYGAIRTWEDGIALRAVRLVVPAGGIELELKGS